MQVKPAISEKLRTYAAGLVGPFPTRYDQILQRAFVDHQSILNASALRELAGGGSNTTAQEAVERFREKLTRATSNRVRFGADMPEEVSTRMSEAMTDLWVECRRSAAAEFDKERERLNLETQEAKTAAETLTSKVVEVQSELAIYKEQTLRVVDSLKAQVDQLTADLGVSKKSVDQLQERTLSLSATLELQRGQNKALQASLDLTREQAATTAATHLAEQNAQRQQFALQLQDTRREQASHLERAIKERDTARAGEAKERSANTELTIAMARLEQRLSQAQAQATGYQDELAKAVLKVSAIESDLIEQRTVVRELQARQAGKKGEKAATRWSKS